MLIYDNTSIAFMKKSEEMVKKILEEMNVKVMRSRFFWNKYLYPINVVVYEGKALGHFDHRYLQIALNRKLIYSAKDSVTRDILRHELAHYFTYIVHGPDVEVHGPEFHDICKQFGFSPDVARATMDVPESNHSKEGDLASEKVLEKVKKLLQLAQSSNTHEADLATVKANSLLLRHNLEFIHNEDEPIYVDRFLHRARKDSKLMAIMSILRHFIVRPVLNVGGKSCCIEVSGTLTNVKLARYVAEFLDRELDQMWTHAKKKFSFEGLRAKNSFFIGVAKGYEQKINKTKSEFTTEEQKGLIMCEKKLNLNLKVIYKKKLGSVTSNQSTDSFASEAGVSAGHKLSVRHGIEGKEKNLYLPL